MCVCILLIIFVFVILVLEYKSVRTINHICESVENWKHHVYTFLCMSKRAE